jgi:hypothetical protein
MSKRGRSKYNRYWFVLRGDVLSYYTNPAELYFPRNRINLQYAISAEAVDTKKKGEDETTFLVTTDERKYQFKADSVASAKEWVRSIQKVIFRTHNEGNSVKISLPIQNVIEIEESSILDFADTVKVRVVDNGETFAIDEVRLQPMCLVKVTNAGSTSFPFSIKAKMHSTFYASWSTITSIIKAQMGRKTAPHQRPRLLRPPPTTVSLSLRLAWQTRRSSQKMYGPLFHLYLPRTWADLASARSLLAQVPMSLERVAGTCEEVWMLAALCAAQVTKCDEALAEDMATYNEEAAQLIARRCRRRTTLNLALFH